MNKIKILFIIIIVLASSLRLVGITHESLWQDELNTLQRTRLGIKYSFNVDIHPPLYYVMINFWSLFFGFSDFSLRFPSVIFGVLSVIVTFMLARELFNQKIALLSSYLVAISEFVIFYSNEAKQYTMLLFLATLSTYYFVKFLKSKRTNIFLYILVSVLAIYTHYYFIFVIVLQNLLFVLFYDKNKLFSWIKTQALILLLFIPQLIHFVQQAMFISSSNWYGNFVLIRELSSMLKGFNNQIGNPGLFILGLFFLVGLFDLIKHNKNNKIIVKKNSLIMLILFVGPLILSIVTSLTFFNTFGLARFFIYIIPPYYIIISRGILKIKNKKLLTLVLIIISLLFGQSIYTQWTANYKTEWKEAAHFLEENASYDDVIIITDWDWMKESIHHYYEGNSAIISIPMYQKQQQIDWGGNINFFINRQDINLFIKENEFINKNKTIWFVYVNDTGYTPGENIIKNMLEDEYLFKKGQQVFKSCKKGNARNGNYCQPIIIYKYDKDKNNEKPV